MAIGLYYNAFAHLSRGDNEGAVELLSQAWLYSELDKISTTIKQLTGEEPKLNKYWKGKQFPREYTLPEIKGKKDISLSEELNMLDERQLFFVCFLSDYRANGPYFDMLRNFGRTANYFPQYIGGMHVITTNDNEDKHAKQWLESEQMLLKNNYPLKILYDRGGSITMILNPSHSPFTLVLNKNGIVLEEEFQTNYEWWNLLAQIESA
jgi:hypothetical protein